MHMTAHNSIIKLFKNVFEHDMFCKKKNLICHMIIKTTANVKWINQLNNWLNFFLVVVMRHWRRSPPPTWSTCCCRLCWERSPWNKWTPASGWSTCRRPTSTSETSSRGARTMRYVVFSCPEPLRTQQILLLRSGWIHQSPCQCHSQTSSPWQHKDKPK